MSAYRGGGMRACCQECNQVAQLGTRYCKACLARRQQALAPYAGETTCLRCERPFQSRDKRKFRRCPRCEQSLRCNPDLAREGII